MTALVWEIWARGKRSAWLVLACIASGAFINLVVIGRLHVSEAAEDIFHTLFGMLMVLSFVLLIGIFNYTEFSSTKEWNGFPYRLFTLPIRTWKLVMLPMFLCVVFAEIVYFAWIKLVWTREAVPMPGWFAVVLGAYVIFYLTTLWCLAGFRIVRTVALAVGGVSSIMVAIVPFFGTILHLSWLTEERLIPIMIALAIVAYTIALRTVARQRSGGGRQRSWIITLANRFVDSLPKRTRDFASPAAAQFWFEWRRSGWLLPACVAFVIVVVIFPISWFQRDDSGRVNDTLFWLLAMPLILGFVIGKNFMNCEFWSTNLAIPNFLAVRPLSDVEYVRAKMKVAAVSVLIVWSLILIFLFSWMLLWENSAVLKGQLFLFRELYPHSWLLVTILCCFGLMVLTWRLMVNGLWVGLSGSRSRYITSLALQVLIPALVSLAAGILSDRIDREIKDNPVLMQSVALAGIGWILAVLVIARFWFAAFMWGKTDRGFARPYMVIWCVATACLLVLAITASPVFDTYRFEHLYVLGALLIFPLARIGAAPLSFAQNRHR